MQVDFTVPEQTLGSLDLGQSASFGLTEDALDFSGTIIGIDPKIDPATRLVSVRAEIDNPDGRLRPGQFVRVRVELPPEPNIIALPQTAVVSSLYGDFVYKIVEAADQGEAAGAGDNAATGEGETTAGAAPADPSADPGLAARQFFVDVGRRFAGMIEITEGVEAGDRIVTAGQNKLTSGTPVTIDNAIDPTVLVGSGT